MTISAQSIEGWLVESAEGLTVALDTTLTPELVNEGLAREFVNRVQNMRKDAGLSVTDRIRIHFEILRPRCRGRHPHVRIHQIGNARDADHFRPQRRRALGKVGNRRRALRNRNLQGLSAKRN